MDPKAPGVKERRMGNGEMGAKSSTYDVVTKVLYT
jgi:hypothetical protein